LSFLKFLNTVYYGAGITLHERIYYRSSLNALLIFKLTPASLAKDNKKYLQRIIIPDRGFYVFMDITLRNLQVKVMIITKPSF